MTPFASGIDLPRNAGELVAKLRSLIDDRRGVTAVEFAIVLPLLVVGYLGVCEISTAYTVSKKASSSATSIADAVARKKTFTASSLGEMTSIPANILAPFTADKYAVKVIGIQVDENGKATVAWSALWDGMQTAKAVLPKGSEFPLPAILKETRSFYVKAEVAFPYKVLSTLLGEDESQTQRMTFADPGWARVRDGKNITCNDCT